MQKVNNLIKGHANFARFFLVGSFNTALDLTLYFIFANLLSIYPVLASILSTGLTMCVSFFLNHHFVFRSSKSKRDTVGRFVAVTLFNVWVIQSLVILLALHSLKHVESLDHHKWTINLVAKLCGIAVSFVLNFLVYRYIFQEKPSEIQEDIVL